MPVTPEYVTHVIERERPDGIMVSFSCLPEKATLANSAEASLWGTGWAPFQSIERSV